MSVRTPPDKIRFEFERPEDYQLVFINGVYGGPTPRRDSLICHFFYEYLETPAAEVGPVRNGQLITNELKPIPRGEVEAGEMVYKRDLKVGLVIPITKVEELAKWMLQRVEQVKEQEKQRAKDPKKGPDIQYSV